MLDVNWHSRNENDGEPHELNYCNGIYMKIDEESK